MATYYEKNAIFVKCNSNRIGVQWFRMTIYIEPVVCAISKGSDQPAHTRRLIRAFSSRLNII